MVICAIPNYRMVYEAASPLSFSNANICWKLKEILVEINLQVVLYLLKHVSKLLLSHPNLMKQPKDSENKNFYGPSELKKAFVHLNEMIRKGT